MMSRAILLVLFTLAFLATLALIEVQEGFSKLSDDYRNQVKL